MSPEIRNVGGIIPEQREKAFPIGNPPVSKNPELCKRSAIFTMGDLRKIAGLKKIKTIKINLLSFSLCLKFLD
ncbi:hypothetical protein NB069_21880 [Leclercia adecarboxylata]|uniref:hypothetical protein n=1 Tax=Leclercia adecarboxylata TaxID=83655 RepID=UPI00202A77D1|nr:hypothetical protein [Leclercia adecarboxylata]URN99260.1 hypothetical protein NB069_21880 [Leclercia adecarboxylata]